MSLRTLLFLIKILCTWRNLNGSSEWAEWNVTYVNRTQGDRSLTLFKFKVDEDSVARIMISSNDSDKNSPLLAVFREKTTIVSVQVPICIEGYMYNLVGRTLCPFVRDENNRSIQYLSVEINSYRPVNYQFRAFIVENFKIGSNSPREVHASASEPVYFQYNIPSHIDSVVIHVDSNTSICMTVSIQAIGCPVFDLANNVISTGIHQTMTKSASIAIERRMMSSFYVIFVVNPNDNGCSEMLEIIPAKPKSSPIRNKTFIVTVESSATEHQFIIPIITTFGIICVIYLVVIVFMIVDNKYAKQFVEERFAELLEEPCISLNDGHEVSDISDDRSIDSYDYLPDSEEKMVVRAKVNLTVADLSMKSWTQRDKKYRRYWVSLLTIALFYGLPVVQLVLTWQETVRLSGDLDLCWYNFRCARPFLGFFAFNNIFSNCGYIFFGLLFIVMVKEKDLRYLSVIRQHPILETKYGLPQHTGLMYAIGIAVVMEGILSASYHICPSQSNYQFDTSFMYVIGMLGMLKIYQLRHPDINANAHVAFAVMAFFILIAMCGVYLNNLPFWIFFSVIYGITMFAVSIEFYFKGQWRFSIYEIRNNIRYAFLSSRHCSCFIPSYKGRFFFLVMGNIINVGFLMYGVWHKPKDFLSFLLFPFIANLFLYLLYYIAMKVAHRESLYKRVLIYLGASFICWLLSMWFFHNLVSDWSQTPAMSRELNRHCMLLDFFDDHDVWHFLSSISIFISFTLMNSIDDDLQFVKRDCIAVF